MASSSPAPSIRSDASPDPPDMDTFDGAGERTKSSKPAINKRAKNTTNKAPAKKTNKAPAKKTPPEKSTPKKQRYTSNRSKPVREVRKPGGANGKSYIKAYEYEAECAAYCGFDDVADLRTFALSPYVMHHYNLLYPVLKSARRTNALSLLHDIKEFDKHWVSDKTPEEMYPVAVHDMNAHYQMSFIAVKTISSIQKGLFTDQDGEAARKTFEELTNNEMPNPPSIETLKFPKLGPFKGETKVEPYNRILNILLYVQFSTNRSNWQNRFGSQNWASSKKLRANDLPDWMREQGSQDPVDGMADEPLHATEEIQTKPIEVQIIWDFQNEEADQQSYITFAKQNHKSLFFMGKPRKSKLSVTLDPRMTVEMFRDAIRVAFDIPNTGSQLLEVWQDLDETLLLSDADWDVLKQALLDGSAKALFNIVLRQREPHETIFEYEGPPLLLLRHLHKQDGDVETVIKVSQEARDRANTTLTSISTSFGHTRFDPLKYFKGDKTRMIKFYDGFDVSTKDGAKAWQHKFFHKIAGQQKMPQIDKKVDSFAKSQYTKIRLDAAQADAIVAAQDQGVQTALDMDVSETAMQEEAQLRYYTYQASGSGTSAQTGPPLDICIIALEVEQTTDVRGREAYKMSRFSEEEVKRTLFPWQVNGTAFVLSRLLGYIPTRLDAPSPVKEAAESLKALRTRCAFINDETGSGKSVFLLACLQYARDHVELDDGGKRIYKMKFLAVPQTLIRQWATEIVDNWPAFDLIISYDDGQLPLHFAKYVVSNTAVKHFPSTTHWPTDYQYVIDSHNPRTGTTIWLTTYETHVERTLKLEKKLPEPEPAIDDEDRDGDETMEAQSEPEPIECYVSNMEGVFDVVSGDEGHKWKTLHTKRWWSAYTLKASCFVFMSATPTINTQQDLLGPLGLVWPNIEDELCVDTEAYNWVLSSMTSANTFDAVGDFDAFDLRRLVLLSPSMWKLLLDTEDLPTISLHAPKVDALASIRRSRASKIPRDPERTRFYNMSDGAKEHFIKTRYCERKTEEQTEFQWLHREAARRFVDASKRNRKASAQALFAPSKSKSDKFIYGTAEMRELCIITGSIVAATFNTIVTQLDGTTLVDSLDRFRSQSFDAFSLTRFVCRATGTQVPTKASEYLTFLCHGSPTLRAVLKHVADGFLDESNGKLIIGEEIPLLAWFYALVLNMGLWDTEVFHAGLSGSERDNLVGDFNKKGKGPRGLIMHFDVGCLGLNMDGDCHEVLVCTSAKNHGTEVQLYGRVIRNTQELVVAITKLFVENSICGYRESKKADKYIVELATRARDPDLRRLMIALLNEYQAKINELHADPDNAELLEKIQADNTMKSTLQSLAQATDIVPENVVDLPAGFEEVTGKRTRKQRTFYSDEIYNENGEYVSKRQDFEDDDYDYDNSSDEEDSGDDQSRDSDLESDFDLAGEEEEELENTEVEGDSDEETLSRRAQQAAKRKAVRKAMASENQLEERARQLQRLLRLPPNKVYTDVDLDDHNTLRRALQLVHCGRLGINPDDVPSPHVQYTHLSKTSDASMEGHFDVQKQSKKFLGFLLSGGQEKNWKGKVPKKKTEPDERTIQHAPQATTAALVIESASATDPSAAGASGAATGSLSMPSLDFEIPHTLDELKQKCRKRKIRYGSFKNDKSKFHQALQQAEYNEWVQSVPPLHRSLDTPDLIAIIRKGHATTPDTKSSISRHDIRKVLFTQLGQLEQDIDYPKHDIDILRRKMIERGLHVSESTTRIQMITRLRFEDLKRILAECAFAEWPLTYLKAEFAILLVDTPEPQNHKQLCLAMERSAQTYEYPLDWEGVFCYHEKAPLSYLRGLCEAARIVTAPQGTDRMALLQALTEHGKLLDPSASEPLHYAEKTYGISANGDPWRKIHSVQEGGGDGQPPQKKQKTGSSGNEEDVDGGGA